MASKTSLAKKSVKKGLDSADCRRRRGETTIQLRKNKREEGIAKRRNIPSGVLAGDGSANNVEYLLNEGSSASNVSGVSLDNLTRYVEEVRSADSELQFQGTRSIRKLLSIENNPPVEAVARTGVLPDIVRFLPDNDNTKLQLEAAWVLTNVASTNLTRFVVEIGTMPHLIPLLTSGNADVREQAVWCLGNIAGDCPELRDICLAHNAVEFILVNIQQPSSISMLRNAAWVLSNLCRGKPAPKLSVVAPCIPIVAQLLRHEDTEVAVDACWALSYLSDGEDARIQAVVDAGVAPHLLHLMKVGTSAIQTPALRTIGNIVSGNEHQTQAIIDLGIAPALQGLLCHKKLSIRKEACWTLSNIAAGTPDQLQQLLNTPELLDDVIDAVANGDWIVKKEAVWVIANIATTGSRAQVQKLVSHNAIEQFCNCLEVADTKIINLCLESLESVLKVGREASHSNPGGSNEYAVLVDECDGLTKLENLQTHNNEEIYAKAVHILETYFGAEEDEDENIAPEYSENSNTFGFGFPTSTTPAASTTFGKSQGNGGFNFNFNGAAC